MIENMKFHSFLFNAHHYSDLALSFIAIYNPWAKLKLLSLLLRALKSQCHLAYSTCFLIELKHISPSIVKNSFIFSVHDPLSFGQHCLQVGNCSLFPLSIKPRSVFSSGISLFLHSGVIPRFTTQTRCWFTKIAPLFWILIATLLNLT